MTTTSLASSVHPLLPYEVQPGWLLLASGVRAGDWIFTSGLLDLVWRHCPSALRRTR
jgi:hypothetical protein